jgi:hypothetical protein
VKPRDTSPVGGCHHQQGTYDKGHITEEPGEGKLSSPVLEQRWAGRLTHRLSQIERFLFSRLILWLYGRALALPYLPAQKVTPIRAPTLVSPWLGAARSAFDKWSSMTDRLTRRVS